MIIYNARPALVQQNNKMKTASEKEWQMSLLNEKILDVEKM